MTEGYTDAEAAALYELLNPWAASDDFYLALALRAESVLDVGCGTGALLARARERGHRGRLVGVDPDRAAMRVARRRDGVEWRAGTAATLPYNGEFELAIMMSHAFQCLVDDDDLAGSLAAIRRALIPGGRFVFETRNPAVRAWEEWDAAEPFQVTDAAGRHLRIGYDVTAVDGDVVTFSEVTYDECGTVLRTDQARLRFLDVTTLDRFLRDAGFTVESRYGGWANEPFAVDSRELVVIARASVP